MNSSLKNKITDRVFRYLGIAATLFGIIMLAIFLVNIFIDGVTRLNLSFLTNLPSRYREYLPHGQEPCGSLFLLQSLPYP
jgi:phosphate transport system permease protein